MLSPPVTYLCSEKNLIFLHTSTSRRAQSEKFLISFLSIFSFENVCNFVHISHYHSWELFSKHDTTENEFQFLPRVLKKISYFSVRLSVSSIQVTTFMKIRWDEIKRTRASSHQNMLVKVSRKTPRKFAPKIYFHKLNNKRTKLLEQP